MINEKQNKGSNAAKRVLRVWMTLKGYSLTGLSNSEISKMLGESAPNVTRALNTLIEEGLVVKLDNNRFAHSIKTLQIAAAHQEHINRMRQRTDQLQAAVKAGIY